MRWWTTKSELRTRVAVLEERLAMADLRIMHANEWIAKLERVLGQEQERTQNERERSDRLQDAYLTQNGLPAATVTVRREQQAAEDKADEAFKHQQQELAEIYGETLGDLVGDVKDLPEEFRELAAEGK